MNTKLILFSGLLLAQSVMAETGTFSLSELKNMDKQNIKSSGRILTRDKKGKLDIRLKAMRDAALMTGAQNGYVTRLSQLKSTLKEHTKELDDLFDFRSIMRISSNNEYDSVFLPPVIEKTNDMVRLDSSHDQMSISGVVYQILKKERLVSAPPDWRQYLIYDTEIEMNRIAPAVLPKDEDEKKKWSVWVQEGWNKGIIQAEKEMAHRIRVLGRDFNGMIRYLILVMEGKIKRPKLTSHKQFVSGNNKKMIVNERTIKVAIPSQMNLDSYYWEPLDMDNRGELSYPYEFNNERPNQYLMGQ